MRGGVLGEGEQTQVLVGKRECCKEAAQFMFPQPLTVTHIGW